MKPASLLLHCAVCAALLLVASQPSAQTERVVNLQTRPGVTQRMIVLTPASPKAAVVLFAGGHGGLQIAANGSVTWGAGNFLVRTRQLFASNALIAAVVDAPSDRQTPPYLAGFRQSPQHAADIKVVIEWLKQQAGVPVWLVGTSMGTYSAASIAAQVAPKDGGPDGLVLTSTVLSSLPGTRPVPDMPLGTIQVPVLVVHHRQDGCQYCKYSDIENLMDKLPPVARKELITIDGGATRGDPCDPWGHHGYNGVEEAVVARIAAWIKQ